MITDKEKQTIIRTATKYHAKRVILFGSALSPDKESRDIDIGVEGIEEKDCVLPVSLREKTPQDAVTSVSNPINQEEAPNVTGRKGKSSAHPENSSGSL